jgi:hypothetical protein
VITIHDFFQEDSEDALRSQVQWQGQHLGLEDRFFAKLLREDTRRFYSWRKHEGVLTGGKEDVLRDWWRTVLHLLSFDNFDLEKVRALLEWRPPQESRSVFSPPWSGSSLMEYLENYGPDAIPEVDKWVESFTFGDPYAPRPKGSPCLSTHA